MNKIDLLKLTKSLTGQMDIGELIKSAEILYVYLNDERKEKQTHGASISSVLPNMMFNQGTASSAIFGKDSTTDFTNFNKNILGVDTEVDIFKAYPFPTPEEIKKKRDQYYSPCIHKQPKPLVHAIISSMNVDDEVKETYLDQIKNFSDSDIISFSLENNVFKLEKTNNPKITNTNDKKIFAHKPGIYTLPASELIKIIQESKNICDRTKLSLLSDISKISDNKEILIKFEYESDENIKLISGDKPKNKNTVERVFDTAEPIYNESKDGLFVNGIPKMIYEYTKNPRYKFSLDDIYTESMLEIVDSKINQGWKTYTAFYGPLTEKIMKTAMSVLLNRILYKENINVLYVHDKSNKAGISSILNVFKHNLGPEIITSTHNGNYNFIGDRDNGTLFNSIIKTCTYDELEKVSKMCKLDNIIFDYIFLDDAGIVSFSMVEDIIEYIDNIRHSEIIINQKTLIPEHICEIDERSLTYTIVKNFSPNKNDTFFEPV